MQCEKNGPPKRATSSINATDVHSIHELQAQAHISPNAPWVRFWTWLAAEPSLEPGETYHNDALRPGERVVIILLRWGRDALVLDRSTVIAANNQVAQIADRRTFDQRHGWPTFTGKRSLVRLRRAAQ